MGKGQEGDQGKRGTVHVRELLQCVYTGDKW